MNDLHRAMMSPEFEKILNADPVLNELERAKYNPRDEYFALLTVLGGEFRVCGIPVQPLTPALWSFLWVSQNAFALNRSISESDVDFMLSLLSTGLGRLRGSAADFAVKSAGFCRRSGIDVAEAATDLREMIRIAFRPLEMIPRAPGETQSPERVFDADWLTRLTSIVCAETNYTAETVMFEISLTSCCYFYVQFLRRNDVKNLISRRPDSELCREIFERTMALGREFLRDQEKRESRTNGD